RLHGRAGAPVPRRPEGAAEGEPRREGAAAPRLPHALGPLARLARGGERRRADAAAERDREGARDEGLHGGRRCRSALRAKRTALSITIEPRRACHFRNGVRHPHGTVANLPQTHARALFPWVAATCTEVPRRPDAAVALRCP